MFILFFNYYSMLDSKFKILPPETHKSVHDGMLQQLTLPKINSIKVLLRLILQYRKAIKVHIDLVFIFKYYRHGIYCTNHSKYLLYNSAADIVADIVA